MSIAGTRFLLMMFTALLSCAAFTAIAFGSEISRNERRSGYTFMGRDTQALQDDRSSNPGMLWVIEGRSIWGSKDGVKNRSCAQCHGDARRSMKGVAARYPAFDAKRRVPIDLSQRINICREEHQGASLFAYESKELLALSTYVTAQSTGLKIAPPNDPRLESYRASGRDIFNLRQGQLNISCAQCHNDNWQGKLAGSAITQAHSTGYPLYRLEWQSLGSLQRRMRNCLTGMRAELYDFGAPEYVALELYLAWRAKGMLIESPAVRP